MQKLVRASHGPGMRAQDFHAIYEQFNVFNFESSCDFNHSTCMKRLRVYPRHLTRASQHASCKRAFKEQYIYRSLRDNEFLRRGSVAWSRVERLVDREERGGKLLVGDAFTKLGGKGSSIDTAVSRLRPPIVHRQTNHSAKQIYRNLRAKERVSNGVTRRGELKTPQK
jgi:hypothetical protein